MGTKQKPEEEYVNNFSEPCSVVRSCRDEKPVHYTLRIQSFSLLLATIAKSTNGRYESRCFNASGYKWRLALKIIGSDHMSVYLVSAEDKVLSSTSEVDVVFTFLVYNHLNNKYLTIQDGKIRCFHAMKTEWGFEKVISLANFNDASNGFLVNDCCAFGVDIFVKKGDEWNGEVLSLVKQPKNGKYTWKIDNFSLLPRNTPKFSDSFTVDCYQWKLSLDFLKPKDEFLSLYLRFAGLKEHPQTSTKVYAEFEISVLSQLDQVAPVTMSYKCWFEFVGEQCGWGTPKFMRMSLLEEPTKGFIRNGTLIIEVKINVMSTLKDFL